MPSKLSIPFLEGSCSLWRSREKYRYKQWHHARYSSKDSKEDRDAARKKWWGLYEEARDKRRLRERQLDAARAAQRPTHASHAGVALICDFEGFFPRPYNDPVGHATIAYGHLIHRGNVTAADRAHWGTLTEKEGAALLARDLASYEQAVRDAVKVPINQNQFDALTSFAYNVGTGALRSSTLMRRLNAGDKAGAADEFLKWDRADGQRLPGLTRRRKAERALFLK